MVLEKRELFSAKEIADHIGVDRQTVINYINSGLLRARKVGGRWRITQAQFDEFWEKSRKNDSN